MIDLITSLWVLLILVVAGFSLIPSKLELSRRLVLLVALAGVGALSYRSINARAGMPTTIPGFDKEVVLMLGFFVDAEAKVIYVWLKQEHDVVPKTYVLGLNKKNLMELKKGRGKHRGKPYYTKITTKVKGTGRLIDKSNTFIKFHEGVLLPKKNR